MQYWKGEKLLKENEPYQMDENRKKNPGPSRKLTFMDEFLLVSIQDLGDRSGISTSLVSRIYHQD